ncbi:GDSL-like lipase/acylhydrolase family protein [Mycoplasma testudineum]|uniref:GDSL-like lipase/acylhydrolase family protein n=1 Tax=Mycoplasma testudineum TaxID=244584 RepID=A0A4R6IFK1_9MOLU|nr:SGNH/GDSL hydrolase family protein [Mycoplasma testudineum]OYD27123.1 hypothetical protein CG473_00570 [Mycoplasma testudineum]TDO21123.1 GDSL-like lipase/acylhydrolase family protein [Mycoplasma testudineum]
MDKKLKIIIGTSSSALAIGAVAIGSIVGTRLSQEKSVERVSESNPITVQDDSGKAPENKKVTEPSTVDTKGNNSNVETPEKSEITNNNSTQREITITTNNQYLIDGSIKYVAFGDSITSGFNAKLSEDYPGELETIDGKKVITGLSYPSFLAKYINEIDSNRLEKYKNFGVTGSTLSDWNALFDNIAQGTISSIHGLDFQSFKTEFTTRLADANLLTISLGANDFMNIFMKEIASLDFNKFIGGSGLDMKMVIANVVSIFTKIRVQMRSEFDKLVANIQKINPKVTINLINYPMPFLRLVDAFDQLTSGVQIAPGQTLSQYLLSVLNEQISDRTNYSDSVQFINVYDEDDWSKYQSKFTTQVLDIHPTEIGYKKIAQEILLKISIDRAKYTNPKSINPSWDDKFLAVDKNKNKQLINFEKSTDQNVINTILGADGQDLFNENDPLILKYKDKFDSNVFPERVITKNSFLTIGQSLLKFVFSSSIFKEIDPELSLYKFFFEDKKINPEDLFEAIYDSKFIQNIWNQFQYLTNEKINAEGTISVNSLIDSLKNAALQADNFHSLIVSVLKSSFFTSDKSQELSTLIQKIISNIFEKSQLFDSALSLVSNFLPSSDSNTSLINIAKTILKQGGLKELLNGLINDSFVNAKQYSQTKNFNEYISIYLEKNKSTFVTFLKTLLTSIVEKNPSDILVLLKVNVFPMLKEQGINLSDSDIEGISKLINQTIFVISESEIVENLYSIFLDAFKNSKELNLATIFSSFLNSITNQNNIYKLVKNIIDSKYFDDQSNRTKYSESLKLITKKLLTQTAVKDLIVNSLVPSKAIANIDTSSLVNTIYEDLISDQKTVRFTDQFIDAIFNNIDTYRKADNFNSFINLVLTSHQSIIVDFVNGLLNKLSNFDTALAKIAYVNLVTHLNLPEIFENEEQLKDLGKLISIVLNAVSNSTIINDIYNSALKSISENGFDLSKIFSQALDAENGYFSIIKALLKSETFKDEKIKTEFKKSLSSLATHVATNEKFATLLIGNIGTYVGEEAAKSIKILWSSLFKSDKFTKLIEDFVNGIFADEINIDNVKTINELIVKMITHNKESFSANVKAVIRYITNENADEFKKLLNLSVENILKSNSFEMDDNSQYEIINFFVDTIKVVTQSQLPEVFLATLSESIENGRFDFGNLTNSFTKVLGNETVIWKLVQALLGSEYLQDKSNVDSYKRRLTKTISILLNNTHFVDLAGEFINNTISQLLQSNGHRVEILKLSKFLITSEKTKTLLANILESIFDNSKSYAEFTSISQALKYFFGQHSAEIENYLKEITKDIAKDDGLLNALLLSVLNEQSKKLNITLSASDISLLTDLIKSTTDIIANSTIYTDTFTRLRSKILEDKADQLEIADLINIILDTENGYFNFIKSLASSTSFANSVFTSRFEANLSNLFKSLIKSESNIYAILNSLKLDLKLEYANANKDIKTILDSNEFQSVLDLAIKKIVASPQLFQKSQNWNDLFGIVIATFSDSDVKTITKFVKYLLSNHASLINSAFKFITVETTKNLNIEFSNRELNAVAEFASNAVNILVDDSLISQFLTMLKTNREADLVSFIFKKENIEKIIILFLNSNYLANNLDSINSNFKLIARIFITNRTIFDAFKNQIVNLITQGNDSKHAASLSNVFDKISKDQKTLEFAEAFIDSIFTNYNEYKKAKSIEELAKIFISKNKTNLVKYFTYILNSYVSKDDDFQTLLLSPIIAFANSNNIYFSSKETETIKGLVSNFAYALSQDYLLNDLINIVDLKLSSSDFDLSKLFNQVMDHFISDSSNVFNLLKKLIVSLNNDKTFDSATFKNQLKSLAIILIKNENALNALTNIFKFDDIKLNNSFKNIINNISSSPDFEKLVDKLLDSILVDNTWIIKSNNFNELIANFIMDKSTSIMEILSNVILKVFRENRQDVLNLFNYSIDKFASQLSADLNEDEKNSLSQLIVDSLETLLISDIPNLLIQSIAANKIETNNISIDTIALEAAKNPQFIYRIVMSLLNSENLSSSYNESKRVKLISKLVPVLIKTDFVKDALMNLSSSLILKIGRFDGDLKHLIEKIQNMEETSTFISGMLTSVLSNKELMIESKNFDELFINYLKINKSNFTIFLKQAIAALTNDYRFKNVIYSIIATQIHNFNVTLDNEEILLMSSVVSQSLGLVGDSKILEGIVDQFIQSFNPNVTATQLLFQDANVLNKIISSTLDFENNGWYFFKLLLSSQTFKNAKSIKDLSSTLYSLLKKLTQNTSVMEKLLFSFTNNQAHLNSSFSKVANKIISNSNFENLYKIIFEQIHYIAANDLVVKYNSYDSLFSDLIKRSSTQLKAAIKPLVKDILTTVDIDMQNVLAFLLKPMLHGANIMVTDEDQNQYAPFINMLVAYFAKTNIINQAIDDAFKAINTDQITSLSTNSIINTVINGVIAQLTRNGQIAVSRILFILRPMFNFVNSKAVGKAFADFLNILFDRSNVNDKYSGFYRIVENFIRPGSVPTIPVEPSETPTTPVDEQANKNEVQVNGISGFDVGNLLNNLQATIDWLYNYVDAFSYRIAQAQVDWQLENPNKPYFENPYYKANYRLVQILVMFLKQVTPDGLFWTGTSLGIETYRYIKEASNRGYLRAFAEKQAALQVTGQSVYQGINQINQILGNSAVWVRIYNYKSTDSLAYIHYQYNGDGSKNKDRHRPGMMIRDTLFKWLEAGYSKKDI